jgi:hypothetical protein
MGHLMMPIKNITLASTASGKVHMFPEDGRYG